MNIQEEQTADLLFRELLRIATHESTDPLPNRARAAQTLRLLHDFLGFVTEKEKVLLTTHFTRAAFVCHQFNVAAELQRYLFEFRKRTNGVLYQSHPFADDYYTLGLYVTAHLIAKVLKQPIPEELLALLPPDTNFYPLTPVESVKHLAHLRVLVVSHHKPTERLEARVLEGENEGAVVQIQYNVAGLNEVLRSTVDSIVWSMPIVVGLMDTSFDVEGIAYPRLLIVEPDYLVDVTAIAECVQGITHQPINYLLRRFNPALSSPQILLGNVVNFFLDELMHHPASTFEELLPKVFHLAPLTFCRMNNDEVRNLVSKAREHFAVIQDVVLRRFPEYRLDRAHCYLEPTFLSAKYGIQGRLDVWSFPHTLTNERPVVVELKSGKPFKPNYLGIGSSHYAQAILYDLLVRSVFELPTEPLNYIFYSASADNPMRIAPARPEAQTEAIITRNNLLKIEYDLTRIRDTDDPERTPLLKLQTEYTRFTGFAAKNIERFENAFWKNASALERRYVMAYVGFIAREHRLMKLGNSDARREGGEAAGGMAALWLQTIEEKKENFAILNHLAFVEYGGTPDDPVLTYAFTDATSPLTRFRKGDIALLYAVPASNSSHIPNPNTPLHSQVFKCTLIHIDTQTVQVRLRARQFNTDNFEAPNTLWHLEPDAMDLGFWAQYAALTNFLEAEPQKRNLWLATNPPTPTTPISIPDFSYLTAHQNTVVRKLLATQDYFLLWGPPGTGKTSTLLRAAVEHILAHSSDNILLLAFTNRAVDEMCESIELITNNAPDGSTMRDNYLRLGSRYSTAPRFTEQLLDRKIQHAKRRDELQTVLHKARIVVGTVAGLHTKLELLELKKFRWVIIDEASQLPEPMLIGLLPQFERVVLIGDHLQLPAVVVQPAADTKTSHPDLHNIGLTDLRTSLFERLYLRAKNATPNSWSWAFDQLNEQGRMHQTLMNFPAQHFYGGNLALLPDNIQPKQAAPLPYTHIPTIDSNSRANNFLQSIATRRTLFIDTPICDDGKTNPYEATAVADLVEAFVTLYRANNLPFTSRTLGIITPYRAQIALIASELTKKGFAEFITGGIITIDTVERYQGGARDVILLSVCANAVRQLATLVSPNADGSVDRKLNVALTRAREQIILIGSANILRTNPIYDALIATFSQP